MSQKELAKLSGVTQSMIAKIEGGKINPSYLKTKSIFDALEGLEKKHQTQVREIMHRKVVGVQADDQVSDVVKLMRETGYSQFPVFSGKSIVGSISEKIMMDRIATANSVEEVSRLALEKVMVEAFARVDEETPVQVVSALLQYDPAVLVTKKGQVTGIVTKSDLLKIIRQ
jgi:predicted transcriptional regulator